MGRMKMYESTKEWRKWILLNVSYSVLIFPFSDDDDNVGIAPMKSGWEVEGDGGESRALENTNCTGTSPTIISIKIKLFHIDKT